jgi:hypothetical protein
MVAVCTFFMLADFRSQAIWIQNKRWVIWGIPWGFSALLAAIGLGVAGYGNIGACKLTFIGTRIGAHAYTNRVLVHE